MSTMKQSEDRSYGNRSKGGKSGQSVTYREDVKKGHDPDDASRNRRCQSNGTIQDDPSSQYMTQLPVIPSRPEKYNPTPYTFRMPVDSQTDKIKESYAKCPPFYLQLDHTLAVVWCVFSKQKINKPLGIAQLQWASSFLKGIYNEHGELSKDVAICIQAIEDELIEQYASMVDDIALEEDRKECCSSKKKGKGGKSASDAKESPSEPADNLETEPDEPKPTIQIVVVDTDAEGEAGEEAKPKIDETVRESKSEEEERDKARATKSGVVTKSFPFSYNYSEMMKSSPVCVEQIYKANDEKFNDGEMKREYEQSKGGVASSCSKDDMANFLKDLRREQVAKIEAELKRLQSIEHFMETCKKENKDG